tara:strand:+ start:40228 stop:40902 length:675 start_codon:yes stop_codon:yes gene_type:complete
MESCAFCDTSRVRKNIVHETKHFVVKVGIGLITAGQVMIIPKQHFVCFGDLPNELEAEFLSLKELLVAKITQLFAKPFLIEYGNWGQSVPHAHMHIIPMKNEQYEVKSVVDEMVKGGNFVVERVSREQLRELYKKEKGYCSIENSGNLYYCHITHLDPETIRFNPHLSYRMFFAQKGVSGTGGSSWQNLSHEERVQDQIKIQETMDVLIPSFKEVTSHLPPRSL